MCNIHPFSARDIENNLCIVIVKENGGIPMKRKNIISKVCAAIVAFAMAFSLTNGMTVQAAEEPQEKSVTFEVTPTRMYASSVHKLGSMYASFGMYDAVAVSNIASFTISSSAVPTGVTIPRIVVESSVSSSSTWSIYFFVGKDNGDGNIDWYIENVPWRSNLIIYDSENDDFSPIGTYYLQFIAVRNTTGMAATTTLNNLSVTVYYY